MRLPVNLFGFHGTDNRAAPLSSAVFAALPSPAQPTLFSDVPQAHVPIDTYASTYPLADQYANFSSGPIDTDLGSLGLEWNGNLLNESTASPHQTTSYDGAYLSTPGPSSFNTLATYALPDATETEPAYYPPNYSAATSTIDDVEDGAYLSTPGPSSFNKLATYALPDATELEPAYYPPIYPPATSSIGDVEYGFNTYLPESANPSFLSDRSVWIGPAPEELPQPEERLIPVETACPEDCFDITDLPLTPPAPLYDSPLQTLYNTSPSTASYNFSPSTASYDTSPSTASFDGSLSEQYPAPYSPAAAFVNSCSPTWPSNARPMLPPSRTAYNTSPSTVSYDTSPSTASFDGSLVEQYPALYSPAVTSVDSCSPTWPSSAKPVLPPSQLIYNTSPSTASYNTSPSTASFDDSLLEQYPAPYSSAATSVDSCSSTWPLTAELVLPPSQLTYNTSPSTASVNGSLSEQYIGPYSPVATSVDSYLPPSSAKLVQPPSGTCLGRPAPYAITVAPSWPIASSSKRRYEDDGVLEMPRTKRIKEVGEYQGLLLPPPIAGSSKRRLEDDEESVDEPLMKKMREMKNKKRPARSAETRARRVSSEALRHQQTLVAGSADCGITTSDTRNETHAYEVEGPEQTPSGSSSQTTQIENATPASSMPIQAAPVRKKQLRCPRPGCTNTSGFRRPAELNRHLLSVHTLKLKCPHGCPKLISRRDALSRHLEQQHGWEGRAAVRKARSIEDEGLAAIGWRK